MTQNEQEVRNIIDVTKFAEWLKAIDMVKKGLMTILRTELLTTARGPTTALIPTPQNYKPCNKPCNKPSLL